MLGVIIRDCAGTILFAWTSKVGLLDPLVAEVQAACFVLKEALFANLLNIILEGDASFVLDPIRDGFLPSAWMITPLVLDARLMLCNFNMSVVRFIPKLANQAAHELAFWVATCNRFGSIPIPDLSRSVLFGSILLFDYPKKKKP